MKGTRPIRVYSFRQTVMPKPPPKPCAMVQRMAKEVAELQIGICELARRAKLQPAHLRQLLAGKSRPLSSTLERVDAALEAMKAARLAAPAQACAHCDRALDDENQPASCSGCNIEGCASCCLPLCGGCSVPLAEAF